MKHRAGSLLVGILRGALKALSGAAFVFLASTAAAQKLKPEDLLQRHRFVFIAEWAMSNGGFRQLLTPTYELVIASDSVDGRLPYYGRVYSSSEAYAMTTEGFVIRGRVTRYDLKAKRKGHRQLNVETQSGTLVQKLSFTIYDDGTARLYINSAWRDAMSYDGRIAESQTP